MRAGLERFEQPCSNCTLETRAIYNIGGRARAFRPAKQPCKWLMRDARRRFWLLAHDGAEGLARARTKRTRALAAGDLGLNKICGAHTFERAFISE